MHTFVIAEIGSAWRFSSTPSVKMLDAVSIAKECGADAIKFQWVSDPRKMEQRRNVSVGSYDILAWPILWLPPVAEAADELGIELICTAFLPEDVETLNPYVKRWKVASLECEDEELLDAIEATGKPVIISSGAMGFNMIPPLLNASMLHCTAAYPAPLDQLNLNVIKTQVYDGYSDHSCNELTGAIAVACGSSMVEVHFRLYDTPPANPDYVHSHTPEKLMEYISNIRKAELMLGDGIKRVLPCEEWALQHKVRS